jgi:drug/metabolite transporter (DMT)-like permease
MGSRLFSIPNTYGLIFLVGGAAWSAIQYARKQGTSNRVLGNWLIALGGLLPAIGGTFTRLGFVEALFLTEFAGILLIWAGYRVILAAPQPSIHAAQQQARS